MRNLLLAATFLTPVSALAFNIDVTSSIANVTVYTDGAAINRGVTTDIPAGSHTIILRGLPAGLDPNSIRADGEGDASFSIVSVDSRVSPGDARPVIDTALESKLEALRGERDALNGAIDAAQGQKAVIQRYAQASPEKLSPESKPLDIDKWPDVWRMIGKGLADANENLRALQVKAKALDEDIAALERARPQPPRPGAPKRDILVLVEAGTPVKAKLSVSYQVPSASWTPVYDAKLVTSGDKPKLDLLRRASIQQRTGEDWNGVAVSLSTVRLRRGTASPDLLTQSLTLVDLQAEAEMMSRARVAAAPAPAQSARPAEPMVFGKSAAADVASPRVAAQPVLAAVEAGAYQTSFTVPGTIDVAQDGTIKTVTLASKASEPQLGVKVTPALDTTAYLEAAFTNDDDTPLLPGEVSLQRDGAFVGKGRLALTASGDKVKLGFGIDDQIKVTRAPVAKRDNDGGFFNSSRTETQDFRTAIKNLHKFPIRIAMIDRIPVSENTAIVVDPLNTNTAPTEKIVEDKRGVMGWSYDYKPGEQREVRLGWRIRWPADRELRRQ